LIRSLVLWWALTPVPALAMAGNSSTGGVGNVIISVQRSLKNAGVLRTVQRALQRIVPEHIFEINHFVFVQASIHTALDKSKDTAPIANLQHRFATIHDRELLTCGGLSLDEVQRHFEAGGRAAVTTTPEGEMVGYHWAIPRYWDNCGWIRCNVSANEFWGAHNFVVPAYRGQKVARQSRDCAYEQLLSEGFEWGRVSFRLLIAAPCASGRRRQTKLLDGYSMFGSAT
jgi:GNAT superfamily N-acetyltransferase